MKRVFEVPLRIIIENEEVKTKKGMDFSKEDVINVVEQCIILDIDTEQSTAIGNNENNFISGLSIDWDKIQEIKFSRSV